MPAPLLPEWSDRPCPVIGMLHLLPLPGSPRYGGRMEQVVEAVMRDASALVEGGVAGLLMENFGDVPFYPGAVPAAVVSHMTALACRVRGAFERVPLGINVLRNDGCAALAIAHAADAQFIRVNVLCGARIADQGILQGMAHRLLRLRRELDAGQIRVFADVDVKHSSAFSAAPIENEVADTLHRGLADAVIVSGAATGSPTPVAQLEAARRAAGEAPVLVGSGVSDATARRLSSLADGMIVGSCLKRDGVATNPVDVQRVRNLVAGL